MTSSMVGLALQLREVVGGGAGTAAQDRDDDAEADHDLGGGHDQHEEHGGLAVDVAEPRSARATNVRLTALSISSTHMNITSGLRRTISPTAPIAEQHRRRARGSRWWWARRRRAPARSSTSSRSACFWDLAGQQHGADDRDDQQHRRELEREHVVGEQVAGQRLDVLVAVGVERLPSASVSRPRDDGGDDEPGDADADDAGQRTLDRERLDRAGPRPCRRRAA